MEWGEHHACLFHGTERFFRAGYNANLITSWLPALDGVVDKLKRGGTAADVGCGHGASTVLMATTYPNSTFVGYDYHAESIRVAAIKCKIRAAAEYRLCLTDAECGRPVKTNRCCTICGLKMCLNEYLSIVALIP